MILTAQIKLLVNDAQSAQLMQTVKKANQVANELSEMAWRAKRFGRFEMHRLFYKPIRKGYPGMAAQMVCQLYSKVANSYKLDAKVKRKFNAFGSIPYDKKILSINPLNQTASIWVIGQRLKGIPFACGEWCKQLLKFKLGSSSLIHKNGNWIINVSVTVPEESEDQVADFIGVDFGVAEIAADSDGNKYSGSALNKIRHRNNSLRQKLQKKGTKSAKRLLKKRRRKEALFARDTNHTISKSIVSLAKRTGRGIAIEELKGIRDRIRAKNSKRSKLNSWSFGQLGDFVAYKAKRIGVKLVKVDPGYTSQRCSKCGHTERSNRRTRDRFECRKCEFSIHADENGAQNIRAKALDALGTGAIKRPHAEEINCGKVHGRTHLQAGLRSGV